MRELVKVEAYLQIFKCVPIYVHGCCGKWEDGYPLTAYLTN